MMTKMNFNWNQIGKNGSFFLKTKALEDYAIMMFVLLKPQKMKMELFLIYQPNLITFLAQRNHSVSKRLVEYKNKIENELNNTVSWCCLLGRGLGQITSKWRYNGRITFCWPEFIRTTILLRSQVSLIDLKYIEKKTN